VHAVVFVIDINVSQIRNALAALISLQDHWFNGITQFGDMLASATEMGLDHLVFHVFAHKMETLANENKTSALIVWDYVLTDLRMLAKFNDLRRRVNQELDDQNVNESALTRTLMFHATSIYDHTIYEAFSDVVTKLIPTDTLGQYENLLNSLHLV
jgi:Gtr1/RagA G protein conserved region